MPAGSEHQPRLLVSVRDVAEAEAAIAGGADILDVKEPQNGSLGRADWQTIQQISSHNHGRLPLSVALGELSEPLELPPSAITGIQFAKIGLAGCQSLPHWRGLYQTRQQSLSTLLNLPAWISVIYADWQSANAPPPEEVLQISVEQQCQGILIDTFHKSGGTLLEHTTPEILHHIREFTREHRLLFAVAGSLRADQFDRTHPYHPDILAVRTAACENHQRTGRITKSQVAELKRLFEPASQPPSNQPAVTP